jgi:predicted metal-dependent hydrolase
MNVESLQFDYGKSVIEFTLVRRDRKTLAISVHPDLRVHVAAPPNAPVSRIVEKVRKRAPWIRKQLHFFEQFQPRTPVRRYVSGETHLYLGRQYKLKVKLHVQEGVKLHRGQILVHSHRPRDASHTKQLIETWYRERARLKFRERLTLCQEKFPKPEKHSPAGLSVRQLRQRWGSMTATGTLIMNLSLIRASVDTIDYVIVHELCHLRHRDHGPGFYKLLDRIMPDWERRKLKLERQLA